MKYHILVNPNACSQKGLHVYKNVEAGLKSRNVHFQTVMSRSSEHLESVISKLSSHPGIRLIVIGGDGTLNHVVDSITDFDNVRLAYIPSGSGNDFWRSLQFPSNPLVLLDTVLEDRVVRKLDVGKLEYLSNYLPDADYNVQKFKDTRRFCVSCGIGFDAAVCAEVDKGGNAKRLLSRLSLAKMSYISAALKLIAGNRNIAMDFTTAEGCTVHLDKAMFLAAMNTRFEGGGFMFAPDADPSDGKLDLCVVGDISTSRFLRSFPLAYKGDHFKEEGVEHYLTSSVEIRTAEPMWVHTDGETSVLSDHIRISCEKEKLQMLM